ncbi:GNAT family N-acetyltransferase [Metabacillus herbersteinensis]|uniref:GNAT family N-acetyltransferase n=1 Tax=Metabacillus herbersteinensis TaxID=283816 RepID=A0ABV6GB14_9BACI
MEIITKRLKLIPATEELMRTSSDDYEMGDHIDYYLSIIENDTSYKGWGVWFVYQQSDGLLIGDIGYKGKPYEGTVEVGYGISTNVQNRGYATEAIEALMNWAFTSTDVHRIKAECLEDNGPSLSVLKKLGMNQTSHDNGMTYWEKHIHQ